jgi:hypothetical protein
MIWGVALGIWLAILIPVIFWIVVGVLVLGGGIAAFSDFFDV